jgi:hypothetical protein
MIKARSVLYLAAGLALVCGILLVIGVFGAGVVRRLTRRPPAALTLPPRCKH